MHQKDMYYNGFTPDDIYITSKGHIKMSNICLETQTDIERFWKNPYYAPPERITSQGIPELKDFYSLGIFICFLTNCDIR